MWLGPDAAAVQHAAREGTDAESVVPRTEAEVPYGRLARPDAVPDLIVYLARARAGSVSDIDILIDAGLTQTI